MTTDFNQQRSTWFNTQISRLQSTTDLDRTHFSWSKERGFFGFHSISFQKFFCLCIKAISFPCFVFTCTGTTSLQGVKHTMGVTTQLYLVGVGSVTIVTNLGKHFKMEGDEKLEIVNTIGFNGKNSLVSRLIYLLSLLCMYL